MSSHTSPLRQVALDLDRDGREQHATTWGGSSTGGHLRLTCDPEMSHERYMAALDEYLEACRG